MTSHLKLITFPASMSPEQLQAVDAMRGQHTGRVYAVLPRTIPLEKVVAIRVDGANVDIEFDAYENIRAGAVRIKQSRFDDPVMVRLRMTHQSVVLDTLARQSHGRAADIDISHDILFNEGTLHEHAYLGAAKDDLLALVKSATPLEPQTGFMEYAPAETTISSFVSAIQKWFAKSVEGSKTVLSADPNVCSHMLYVTYRDEFRLHNAAEVKAAIKGSKDPGVQRVLNDLWGVTPTATAAVDTPEGSLRTRRPRP
ncbi:hypothetical protein [Paucibacter soli]|uniref:hypothetical protein n=1 Tax=Paucibacter soli TaxID=3133433 RepID=UPI00309C3078